MTKLQLGGSLAFALCLFAFAGCSTRSGSMAAQDRFVPPNSTVRVLGEVSAKKRKVRFLGIGAYFDSLEIMAVHADALNQMPGANAILDVSSDSTITLAPFVWITTYEVKGKGAEVLVYDPAAAR